MTAFILFLLLQAGAVPKASISGIVIDAGAVYPQPLFHARVEILRDSGSRIVAHTDVEGRFVFPDLPSGRYQLIVTDDGYLRKMATFNITPGQQRNDIIFGLDLAPTIFGHIKDEHGIPIPNILVEALKVVYGPRGDRSVLSVVSALSDDRGDYHLYWLDPGDYYIRATSMAGKAGFVIPGNPSDDSPGSIYAPTYFPGYRDPKDAAKVLLRLGSLFSAFDFKMQSALQFDLGGHVSIEATGAPVGTTITVTPAGAVASTQQYFGRSADPLNPLTLEPGKFQMGGMPQGTYVVSAEFTKDGQLLTVNKKVTLKTSERSVILQLSSGSIVNGRIATPNSVALDFHSTRVSLESVDSDLPSLESAAVDAVGKFTAARVPPGEYAILITGLPDDAYVKSAQSGDKDILAAPLRIDWKSPESIRVVLGVDGGRLNGSVLDSSDRAVEGSQVVLVPDAARRSLPSEFRVTLTDEDGRFTLRGISPGEYKLFAWQGIEANAYMDANFMEGYESLGMAVSIAPGSSGAASVRVIPLY